ncbi:hypothetical protein [Embleya sp. AB8]|uniref:hypothetical protein n=1 Tax=Embleya sp. AB8 TaxID=3156304 RepID=UPI003C776D2C
MKGWHGERWFLHREIPTVPAAPATARPGTRVLILEPREGSAADGSPLAVSARMPSRRAENMALFAAEDPRVKAVALAPPEAVAPRTGPALLFSRHLRAIRGAHGLAVPAVTSALPPERPVLTVRIAHLVTVAAADGPQDTVVWELMPTNCVLPWLGHPLPNQARFLEDGLPQLIEAKRMARRNRLMNTGPAGLRVSRLLHLRYLGARVILRNVDLFLDLIAEIERLPPSRR